MQEKLLAIISLNSAVCILKPLGKELYLHLVIILSHKENAKSYKAYNLLLRGTVDRKSKKICRSIT